VQFTLTAKLNIDNASGGSWLVGTYLAFQNKTIPDLIADHWNLSSNLVIPDNGLVDNVAYFTDMLNQVKSKKDAGFETQITE
jgi:hypothetical protein